MIKLQTGLYLSLSHSAHIGRIQFNKHTSKCTTGSLYLLITSLSGWKYGCWSNGLNSKRRRRRHWAVMMMIIDKHKSPKACILPPIHHINGDLLIQKAIHFQTMSFVEQKQRRNFKCSKNEFERYTHSQYDVNKKYMPPKLLAASVRRGKREQNVSLLPRKIERQREGVCVHGTSSKVWKWTKTKE